MLHTKQHTLLYATLLVLSAVATANPLVPEDEARNEYLAVTNSASLGPESHVELIHVFRSPRERLAGYFLNPYLAFDIGLTTQTAELPATAYDTVLSWLVHRNRAQSGGDPTYRLKRDGRMTYLGYVPIINFSGSSQGTALARVAQKGDLATNIAGAHKDGHVDAVETLMTMITSEILHRHGIYTTRTLLAGQLNGIFRNLDHGQDPSVPAGIEIRIGDRPRIAEPHVPAYFSMMGHEAPRWSHPLLVSGLEYLPIAERMSLVAAINEAMLKDLWALHGSLSHENKDYNRAEALTDLATLAFLDEPNLGARIQGGSTSFWDEERSGSELYGTTFSEAFAFHQLRRQGLDETTILAVFFEQTETRVGAGTFVKWQGRPETLELATILKRLNQHQARAHDTFNPDVVSGVTTEFRVVYNTRRLLRLMVTAPQSYFERSQLTDTEVNEILNFIKNPAFAGVDPLANELATMRRTIFSDLRKLHQILRLAASAMAQDRTQIQERAMRYPEGQNLPNRDAIRQLAWHWLQNPFSFGREFPQYVQSLDPPTTQAALLQHYQDRHELPAVNAKAMVGRLTSPCFGLLSGN